MIYDVCELLSLGKIFWYDYVEQYIIPYNILAAIAKSKYL